MADRPKKKRKTAAPEGAAAAPEAAAAGSASVAGLFGSAPAPDLSQTFSKLFAAAPAPKPPAATQAAKAAPSAPAGNGGKGKGDAGKGGKGTGDGDAPAEPPKKPFLTEKEKRARDARTLFLANVPINWEKKKLQQALKEAVGEEYKGKFNPIWFRSIPVKENFKGRQRSVGAKIKAYDDSACDCKNAYVVLDDAAALKTVRRLANGFQADALHTFRADGVGEHAKLQTFDRKRSVMLGNLAPNTSEAALRDLFKDVGEISAVRIVRDKETAKCRGIAFILFAARSSVKPALQYWGTEVLGRQIRVTQVEQRKEDRVEEDEEDDHPAARRLREKEEKWRRQSYAKYQWSKSSSPWGADSGWEAEGGAKKKRKRKKPEKRGGDAKTNAKLAKEKRMKKKAGKTGRIPKKATKARKSMNK